MLDLAQLELFLHTRLLGQREAIGEFASAVVRAERGPRRPGRTKAFVLLLGPTGTGKTEMVNLTTRFLYGDEAERRLARFDMGEYQHPDSVKRLLGAPQQPPLLGEAIARLNRLGGGILLLDEIEKAFPDLLTALLSFDAARSTMFDGTTHDLSGLIVVLTSNLGAAEAARMEHSGYAAITRKLRHAAEERFRKEGVARFSAVVCMNVLGYAVQEQIARNLVARETLLQAEHLRRAIVATSRVVPFLVGKGFTPDLGARNIRNCVERFIGEALQPHWFASWNDVSAARPPVRGTVGDRWSDALVVDVDGDNLVATPLVRQDAAGGQPSAANPDTRRSPDFTTSAPVPALASALSFR